MFPLELRATLAGLALSAALASVHAHGAPPLPAAVVAQLPAARLQGSGELTYFGLAIYDAFYWGTHPAWMPDEAFALDLVYHRTLSGARIAERSESEIATLGYGTAADRARWLAAMNQVFPDVGKGDRLTGLNVPHAGARFFLNGRLIGEISEPAFAHAFFAIWMDPKTSQPELRRQLLGAR